MAETAVYLDHNATTPVDPAVLDAMLPRMGAEFGNPSSAYALGRRAHDAVEKARAAGALAHADAAQSLDKMPVDVAALGVDLLTIVGYKLYAPKGGALRVPRRRAGAAGRRCRAAGRAPRTCRTSSPSAAPAALPPLGRLTGNAEVALAGGTWKFNDVLQSLLTSASSSVICAANGSINTINQ